MFTVSILLLSLIGFASAQEPAKSGSGGLLAIKTLCVEPFAGDPAMAQAREFVFASLFAAKIFKLTENCGAADATLKGAALEKTTQRARSERESAFGAGGGLPGGIVGGSENLSSSEARSEASVALRITRKDGEIVWATSQDSTGGKNRAALPDAVDRAVRQLLREIERAQKP